MKPAVDTLSKLLIVRVHGNCTLECIHIDRCINHMAKYTVIHLKKNYFLVSHLLFYILSVGIESLHGYRNSNMDHELVVSHHRQVITPQDKIYSLVLTATASIYSILHIIHI